MGDQDVERLLTLVAEAAEALSSVPKDTQVVSGSTTEGFTVWEKAHVVAERLIESRRALIEQPKEPTMSSEPDVIAEVYGQDSLKYQILENGQVRRQPETGVWQYNFGMDNTLAALLTDAVKRVREEIEKAVEDSDKHRQIVTGHARDLHQSAMREITVAECRMAERIEEVEGCVNQDHLTGHELEIRLAAVERRTKEVTEYIDHTSRFNWRTPDALDRARRTRRGRGQRPSLHADPGGSRITKK